MKGVPGRSEQKDLSTLPLPPEMGPRWCWNARGGHGLLMSVGAETLGFVPVDTIAGRRKVVLLQEISKAFYQWYVLSSTENMARLEQMTASINQLRATH